MKESLTIGIVGATGVVGQTAIDILADEFSHFDVKALKLFASRASVGKRVSFKNTYINVEELTLNSLLTCDALFFASDSKIAEEFIPACSKAGVLCIDKSSAYRMSKDVPLVVPEVNSCELQHKEFLDNPIVSNPNCCTIPLTIVLSPIHKKWGIKRVIVSTYQSVSGAGKQGLDALTTEVQEFFRLEDITSQVSKNFPKPIAFNVLPFVASLKVEGDTDEEEKIVDETRKILSLDTLKISATSVRVPTLVGHAESITLELNAPATVREIKECLSAHKEIYLVEDSPNEDEDVSYFPTPRDAQGRNDVLVGRIRPASVFDDKGVSLFLACDNLRKGAALNAVQILDECGRLGILSELRKRRNA